MPNQKPNPSEYTCQFQRDAADCAKVTTPTGNRTLYQSLDSRGRGALLNNTAGSTQFQTTMTKTLCQLTEKLSEEPDFLTTYQLEFSQDQKAQAAKRKAQLEASAALQSLTPAQTNSGQINGMKTTGKFELRKHEKNTSNLYYLLESQAAKDMGIADPPQRVNVDNSEEHFKFGTYHWKRCDVTKEFHPGLCYR